MAYFAILVGLAVVLTYMSLKVRMILFRLGAFLGWLSCGIYLLIGGNSDLSISNEWNQVLGFLFLVMAFTVLVLQIVVETKRTGKDGSVYTEWSRPKKVQGPSRSQVVQDSHREVIRHAVRKR